jgi:HK97 gp10 family phage protein
MSVKVEIKGIEDTRRFLADKQKAVKQQVETAIKEGGILLKEEVQNSIKGNRAETRSVDTGAFLQSVNIDQGKNNSKVYSDIEYAKFLEFGTSRISPRRHFQNSADRVKPVVQGVVGDYVKKACK